MLNFLSVFTSNRRRSVGFLACVLGIVAGLYHFRAEFQRLPPSLRLYFPSVWSSRSQKVKDAFIHSYHGYLAQAANHDELLPVTGGHDDKFNGWKVTLVDSLDTMWIMGFHEDFAHATAIVANETFQTPGARFFETVIRYLGGLLSAYSLSGEPIFLSRADDLGRMLLPAFNTLSGIPRFAVNTISGETIGPKTSLWAEATTCQMEYKYLAHLTGRAQYFHGAEKVMNTLYSAGVPNGLFPSVWDIDTGIPVNQHLSVGAYADSGYEYLLKQWLVSGRYEIKARDQYLQSITGILDRLLYLSPTRQLLYVTDLWEGKPSHNMEHLACFLPAVIALGAATLPLSPAEYERHMWAARGLTHTCWTLYADTASGLAPDIVRMDAWPSGGEEQEGYATGRWKEHLLEWEDKGRPGGVPPGLGQAEPVSTAKARDYIVIKDVFMLRPETIESFYYLWKLTGEKVWRERSWTVFEAIERTSRTRYGYAMTKSLDKPHPHKVDEMPSWFLAETLKYLYLHFIDEDPFPLDQWVFTTEAHPIRIYNSRAVQYCKPGLGRTVLSNCAVFFPCRIHWKEKQEWSEPYHSSHSRRSFSWEREKERDSTTNFSSSSSWLWHTFDLMQYF